MTPELSQVLPNSASKKQKKKKKTQKLKLKMAMRDKNTHYAIKSYISRRQHSLMHIHQTKGHQKYKATNNSPDRTY